ncbi:beta-lactamase family protein, partial [Oscillatoriales cyanobacterium LEGE 11467]
GRETLPGGFVIGYEDWDGDGKPDNMNQYNNGYGLGDGGLISTARDLATFARALLADEELLDPETFDEMLDWVEDGDGNGYGLGVSVWDSEWGEVWGHDGSSGGFLSTLWYLPEEDAIVVVLANHGENADPDEIARAALSLVLD